MVSPGRLVGISPAALAEGQFHRTLPYFIAEEMETFSAESPFVFVKNGLHPDPVGRGNELIDDLLAAV